MEKLQIYLTEEQYRELTDNILSEEDDYGFHGMIEKARKNGFSERDIYEHMSSMW